VIDPVTGYDDDYDEALKFCIEEIISEIHRVKELEQDAVETIFERIFEKTIEERYQEYLDDCRTD